MTRASQQRVDARRIASRASAFRMPPPGMLSEQIDLQPFGLVLGLIHPEGSPLLVCAWNGEGLKRMVPDEASTWADELVASGHAVPLAPVIGAIRKLVRRAGEIVTASIMQTAGSA